MDDGYFHGINKLKKPGFKVINPPGGQTQINIFEQNHQVQSSPINPCQAERNSSNVFAPVNGTPVKSNADRNSSSIIFGGPEPPASVNQQSAPVNSFHTDVPKKENTSESDSKKENSETGSPASPVNQLPGDPAAPVIPAHTDVPKKESPSESPKSDSKKENADTRSPAASAKQPSGDPATPVTPSSKPNSRRDNNKRSENQPIRSSTKVIAPPGGKSSINLYG